MKNDEMANNMAKHKKRIQRDFNNFNMAQYLLLYAIRNAERQVTLSIAPLGSEGTSYTNFKHIVISLWGQLYTKTFSVIKMCMEVFTAHEAEHCRSSNKEDMQLAAKEVGEYYNKKYGYNAAVGEKLGAALYNSIDDGRIERISCNRFPGQIRGFKYINAIIWKQNALNLNEERSMYADFMSAILCLSKTGVKPENWDVLYLKTEADDILNKIAYLIYDATCSDFTEDVRKAVVEINKIIDPFIYEALKNDSDLLNKLEEMAQNGSDAMNDAQTQASQAGSNGSGGYSINIPQGISKPGNGNGKGNSSSQGAGVGNTNGAKTAEDAFNGADVTDKTADDMSNEMNNRMTDIENEVENDQEEQDAIDKRMKQQEQQREANSDEEVTDDELKKLSGETGLNFGNTKIENFQQALQEVNIYEPSAQVLADGMMIYNKLKNLFIKRNDLFIRRQKRGRLDTTRLSSMVAMRGAGQIEDKIFYKIRKTVEASCAAYIIVDTSGSTGGYVFNEELDACAKIEVGFAKLIPFKIAAYDSGCDFRFRVIRDFNNKSRNINLSYNFKKHESDGGGTPTAEAMALAGYELSKRKEKNKLLIILTDGSPDNNAKVKKEAHDLRKKGIKVVPILIQDGSDNRLLAEFNDMYENRDVITEHPSKIAKKLTEILERWILTSFRN